MDIITEMEPRRMISADRRLFAKVIGNLISNAYHYSPAGEKIHIRVEDTDQGVQFTVENTGVHIPEQEIADLFEAFTRRGAVQEQGNRRRWSGTCHRTHGAGTPSIPHAMENTEDGMRFRILFPRRPHAS